MRPSRSAEHHLRGLSRQQQPRAVGKFDLNPVGHVGRRNRVDLSDAAADQFLRACRQDHGCRPAPGRSTLTSVEATGTSTTSSSSLAIDTSGTPVAGRSPTSTATSMTTPSVVAFTTASASAEPRRRNPLQKPGRHGLQPAPNGPGCRCVAAESRLACRAICCRACSFCARCKAGLLLRQSTVTLAFSRSFSGNSRRDRLIFECLIRHQAL